MTAAPQFVGSKLESLYLRELHWLAYQIDTTAGELFEQYKIEPEKSYASADIKGLQNVYSILSNAAKINELLFAGEKSNQFSKRRASALQAVVHDLALSELYQKKLRNTVEHFGEYLDADNLTHSPFTSPVP